MWELYNLGDKWTNLIINYKKPIMTMVSNKQQNLHNKKQMVLYKLKLSEHSDQ